MNKLLLKNVSKTYTGGYTAIAASNIELQKGEKLCILGEIGSGKTTLLKLIAGLENRTSGEILFDGSNAFDLKELNIGYYTEDAMKQGQSVLKAIKYPLILRNTDNAEFLAIQAAARFEIENLIRLRIKDLNKTQRKLVALARTFAIKRDLYLLDNPFGDLPHVTNTLTDCLLNAIRDVEGAVILTTDNVEEAEKIGFMKNALLCYGVLGRTDALHSLRQIPDSLANAVLISDAKINIVPLTENGKSLNELSAILDNTVLIGEFDNITAAFYYDDFIMISNGIKGKIVEIASNRSGYLYTVEVGKILLKMLFQVLYDIGDEIYFAPKSENVKIFDTMSELDIVKRN